MIAILNAINRLHFCILPQASFENSATSYCYRLPIKILSMSILKKFPMYCLFIRISILLRLSGCAAQPAGGARAPREASLCSVPADDQMEHIGEGGSIIADYLGRSKCSCEECAAGISPTATFPTHAQSNSSDDDEEMMRMLAEMHTPKRKMTHGGKVLSWLFPDEVLRKLSDELKDQLSDAVDNNERLDGELLYESLLDSESVELEDAANDLIKLARRAIMGQMTAELIFEAVEIINKLSHDLGVMPTSFCDDLVGHLRSEMDNAMGGPLELHFSYVQAFRVCEKERMGLTPDRGATVATDAPAQTCEPGLCQWLAIPLPDYPPKTSVEEE